MLLGFLRKFRIALAASVGLAITLATIAGIFLSLKVDPKMLRLADRIDASRTIVYVSTNNRETLMATIKRYETMMHELSPKESDIAVADRYEFALLRTAPAVGTFAWIIEWQNAKDVKKTTLVSVKESPLSIQPNEHRKSLASSALFTNVSPAASFVWFDIASLPLPDSPASTILRSITDPANHGLLVWNEPYKGTLFLEGKTLKSADMLFLGNDLGEPASLFWMGLGNPTGFMETIAKNMNERDPGLFEGIKGILQNIVEKRTGSTDLKKISDDLLAGPMLVATDTGSGSLNSFYISGVAKNTSALTEWVQALSSLSHEGSVRQLQFFGKEYARTDVTAGTKTLRDVGNVHGWSLKQTGESGMIAQSGRQYIVGNSREKIEYMLRSPTTENVTWSATLDVPWTLAEAKKALPLLSPGLDDIVRTFFAPGLKRLGWEAKPFSGGLRIDWTLLY